MENVFDYLSLLSEIQIVYSKMSLIRSAWDKNQTSNYALSLNEGLPVNG
jgi:hypothetical protein